MDLREVVLFVHLMRTGEGFSEHSDETFGSIKGAVFLD
jgi:hypothetical protein